ncbi:hypothetical protein GIB67_033948 [Kingdonia uniflora]|uniref:Uncharacterized protein n=1 Tax=Kingdonia uniflora TaxID=39325 RepID=A0A7J7PAV8_9MAGN|nr:hypothetical protein GIB67_033948 [Kingdonia uniflora]
MNPETNIKELEEDRGIPLRDANTSIMQYQWLMGCNFFFTITATPTMISNDNVVMGALTNTGKWKTKEEHELLQGDGISEKKTMDNASSLASRVKKSDAWEIESFYQQYYEKYVRALDQGEQADRAQLGKAYQTAGVLFEVLCAVNKTENVEIIAAAKDVREKKEIYTPYNILPLDAAGASQSIMQLEEVKVSVAALRNTHGLNWPSAFEQLRQKAGDLDLLDWLRAMFGFQVRTIFLIYNIYYKLKESRATNFDLHLFILQRDNVRNQREHLILMLANVHIRLVPKPEPLNKACSALYLTCIYLCN